MDWPADWTLPNWRHVTIAAADRLALRIIDHSPDRSTWDSVWCNWFIAC
jgi:hypothetical protein